MCADGKSQYGGGGRGEEFLFYGVRALSPRHRSLTRVTVTRTQHGHRTSTYRLHMHTAHGRAQISTAKCLVEVQRSAFFDLRYGHGRQILGLWGGRGLWPCGVPPRGRTGSGDAEASSITCSADSSRARSSMFSILASASAGASSCIELVSGIRHTAFRHSPTCTPAASCCARSSCTRVARSLSRVIDFACGSCECEVEKRHMHTLYAVTYCLLRGTLPASWRGAAPAACAGCGVGGTRRAGSAASR